MKNMNATTEITPQIIKRLKGLPKVYLYEIFDFVEFFIQKKASLNDTEYLKSVKGMAEKHPGRKKRKCQRM